MIPQLKKNNVVLINLDGFRVDALAYAPYLQSLKKKASFFPHAFTYAPYTVASLPAVMTGLYGNSNGVDAYYKSNRFNRKTCFTIAQYFSHMTYHTIADVVNEHIIPGQGFDKVFIHDENRDNFIERHCGIIKEAWMQKKPFFTFFQYSPIHARLVRDVITKYDDFSNGYFDIKNRKKNVERYKSEIKNADLYIESICNVLASLHIDKKTLIILFSDHGCSLGERKGEKAYGVYLYDYTLNVFIYLIAPELPQGLVINNLVRTIDILPTILDLFRLKPKQGYVYPQGTSLLPLIDNKENEERISFSETGGVGGPAPSPHKPNLKCIRTPSWKLIYNITQRKKELYDMENDKSETVNLIDRDMDIKAYLWELLKTKGNLKPGIDYEGDND